MTDGNGIPSSERPAVPAPPDLHAEYRMDPEDPHGGVTLPIYAFSVEGHPLVEEYGGTRLVRAEVGAGPEMTYVGIRLPEDPPLTGPFTPALPGPVAVFHSGHEEPILYYDVHGRPVLLVKDEGTCYLALAEDLSDVKRIEYRPSSPMTDD
jgi:hypothetical protein